MNKIIFPLLFTSLLTYSQKEKKGNAFSNAAKMGLAKQKLYAGSYAPALNIYRELDQKNSKDVSVKYYMGLCYFNLGQYENSKKSLLEGLNIGVPPVKETHLLLGKIYQIEQENEKALNEFDLYLSLMPSEKESIEEAGLLQKQCTNAKNMTSNPVDVNVTIMSEGVNSKYDDKNPCITADGKKMVFTTRRPETTNDITDTEGDGKYFEDIYIAQQDSLTKNFANARSAGKPVNTAAHDACTSISPDGKMIFIYKNDINDKASRGGDVFVSKIANGKWKTPEPVGKPVASTYWEGGACISSDGSKYFFSSEREPSYGGSDIWMVEKINKKEWGKPVNLGSKINTAQDEAGMFLAPDGKTLFFCSNGPNSMGSYDVFRTTYENGAWTEPVNLGYPINSVAKEGQLTISADARYAYISSNRKGGLGESDIYKIDLKDYALLEKDFKRKHSNGLCILKGTIREGFEGYGIPDAEVTVKDEAGTIVSSGFTNENGEYFFTLHSGKYTIVIKKKDYKEINESIELPTNEKETPTIEKGYLLKK